MVTPHPPTERIHELEVRRGRRRWLLAADAWAAGCVRWRARSAGGHGRYATAPCLTRTAGFAHFAVVHAQPAVYALVKYHTVGQASRVMEKYQVRV
jgi:hypothetical protein